MAADESYKNNVNYSEKIAEFVSMLEKEAEEFLANNALKEAEAGTSSQSNEACATSSSQDDALPSSFSASDNSNTRPMTLRDLIRSGDLINDQISEEFRQKLKTGSDGQVLDSILTVNFNKNLENDIQNTMDIQIVVEKSQLIEPTDNAICEYAVVQNENFVENETYSPDIFDDILIGSDLTENDIDLDLIDLNVDCINFGLNITNENGNCNVFENPVNVDVSNGIPNEAARIDGIANRIDDFFVPEKEDIKEGSFEENNNENPFVSNNEVGNENPKDTGDCEVTAPEESKEMVNYEEAHQYTDEDLEVESEIVISENDTDNLDVNTNEQVVTNDVTNRNFEPPTNIILSKNTFVLIVKKNGCKFININNLKNIIPPNKFFNINTLINQVANSQIINNATEAQGFHQTNNKGEITKKSPKRENNIKDENSEHNDTPKKKKTPDDKNGSE